MSETVTQTESTSVPLDSEKVDYQQFKAARAEGKETVEIQVEKPVVQEPSEAEDAEIAADPETAKEESKETGNKPKRGVQQRFSELTRQRYEAQAERDLAKKESAELKEKLAQFEKGTSAAKPEPTGKPTADQYKTYEEFTEALTDWKYDQRSAKAKETETKSQEEAKGKETFDAFLKRVDTFKSTVEDYDEVTSNPDIMIPEVAQVAIIESDDGPAIGYFLCKNPDVAAAMLKMTPARQAVEIGRISARLEAESSSKTSSPEKKTVTSKAPEPIKPVAAGATQSAVSPDQMSYADYKIWRAKNG